MAILVTGGAGYIGSHMALALLDAGETVVIVDDLSTGFRWAVPSKATLHIGDIGDEDFVTELCVSNDIEAIIHFAAKIVVPESIVDPLRYYDNNTAKARALLQSAVDCGVKHVVFSSTAAVYGEPDRCPVSEDDRTAPINPYGRSKLMVEWMLADVARAHPLSYAALRYFNVAGADPLGRAGQSTRGATHLIKAALEAALGVRSGIDVFGGDYPTPDGTCLRDYIHVSDLVDAHLAALAYLRGGDPSLVCNVGYGHGASVLEVIDVVKKVSGVDFPVRMGPRRIGDPAAIIASNARARETLGWSPRHDDLEAIVRQALAWEKRLQAMRADQAA